VSKQTLKRRPGGEQLIEALLGGALFGFAATRRGRNLTTMRMVGMGLVVAAFAPTFTRKLLRVGAARRRIHLRTTLQLDRPVHEVFEFCRDFENFPRVIQSIRCIADYQDGRSRWEVISPSGEILAWDTRVTKYVPNTVIAWQSMPGSVVDCDGLIRFSPSAQGGTALQIEIDYDPGHTGVADAIRAMFDAPRTEQLESDLARANFYLAAQPPATTLDADDHAEVSD